MSTNFCLTVPKIFVGGFKLWNLHVLIRKFLSNSVKKFRTVELSSMLKKYCVLDKYAKEGVSRYCVEKFFVSQCQKFRMGDPLELVYLSPVVRRPCLVGKIFKLYVQLDIRTSDINWIDLMWAMSSYEKKIKVTVIVGLYQRKATTENLSKFDYFVMIPIWGTY